MIFRLPLRPAQAQTFKTSLGGFDCSLAFRFLDVPEGGWVMDIADFEGNRLACGIPLVTGADLLAQHGSLGIPGKLWVMSDGVASAGPTWENLGVASQVYFES